MHLWCKLPDDILHMACATVSFAITFGQQLKKQAGAGLVVLVLIFCFAVGAVWLGSEVSEILWGGR